MKKKEFVNALENLNLGLFVSYSQNNHDIFMRSEKNEGNDKVLDISHNTICTIDTWSGFFRLSDSSKRKLFDIACEFAKTPLEER